MIHTFNIVKAIALKISSANGSSIVPVVDSSGIPDLASLGQKISVNTFVKNLKAFVQIESLDPINMPNFTLEDSETDKLYKSLEVEWGSPRKQLNLYISNNQEWHLLASISLLNPSGYPYRIYSLQDLITDNPAIELGEEGKIGVSIENVGYGLLGENDKVTIHGSYLHEIVVNQV